MSYNCNKLIFRFYKLGFTDTAHSLATAMISSNSSNFIINEVRKFVIWQKATRHIHTSDELYPHSYCPNKFPRANYLCSSYFLPEQRVLLAKAIPIRLNIIAMIEPAFPLPDPNIAPAAVIKCAIQKATAIKPNIIAVFAPFLAERFFARMAITRLANPNPSSTSPIARAVVIPLT